jgi:hypothetical protein
MQEKQLVVRISVNARVAFASFFINEFYHRYRGRPSGLIDLSVGI